LTNESNGPDIQVAVALVKCGPQILVNYNPRWGAFCLPMTKRRQWEATNNRSGATVDEEWSDAAARAAGEALLQTFLLVPKPILVPEGRVQQSGADLAMKCYHFQVFKVIVDPNALIVAGARVEWLSADELKDKHRQPISPTTRWLIEQLSDEHL
jgi:hypothetical protein